MKIENPALRGYISGTFGGVCGVLVGHPADLIKVRLQVQHIYGGGTSSLSVLSHAVRSEGIAGVYRGITPPLIAEAIINSFLFGTYTGVLSRLAKNPDKPDMWAVYLAGCAGGLPGALCNSPLELLKTRIQVQTFRYKGIKFGIVECFKHSVRQYGFFDLFTGLHVTIIRDVPSYGLYFLVYESFKNFVSRRRENGTKTSQFVSEVVGGGLAGMAAWGSTYPFDVVKTRLQTQRLESGQPRYRGVVHCFVTSAREEGLAVFTKGLAPTLIRAFPTNAAIFVGYEFIKKRLS